MLGSIAFRVAAQIPGQLADLMSTLSRVDQVRARYTETLESSLLSTRISNSGQLSYKAPNRIVKTGDDGNSLVIEGDRVLVEHDGNRREISVRDHPALQALVIALRSVFSGDLKALRTTYQTEYQPRGLGWELTMRPRSPSLQGLFTRLVMTGDGAKVDRIEIDEANGDRRVIALRRIADQSVTPTKVP